VLLLDHTKSRNRPKSRKFARNRTISHELVMRIQENWEEFVRICTILCEIGNFFGFTRITPIRDCFFQKLLSLEHNLYITDTNSCISGSCEFEFLKFVSSLVWMITVYGKNNRESAKPEKIPEFAWNRAKSHEFFSILLNSHHEFVTNRAISGDFAWILKNFKF
jgi:hypothetical protein